MKTVAGFLLVWCGVSPLLLLAGFLLGWFSEPQQWGIIAWAIVGICTALLIWALDAIAEHTP